MTWLSFMVVDNEKMRVTMTMTVTVTVTGIEMVVDIGSFCLFLCFKSIFNKI
jgi:hypothetical protein